MTLVPVSTLGDSFTGEYERIADIELAGIPVCGWWLVLNCEWGAVHIVPVLDGVKHHVAEGDECLCGPELELVEETGAWLVTHASLDGREHNE